MRSVFLAAACVLAMSASAVAHCGKPHPGSKEKTETSRPAPKPE